MNKVKLQIKDIRLVIVAAIVFAVGILSILTITNYAKGTTDSMSKSLIRFHVVANSDTTEDQLLKQKVRDEVIGFMQPLIKECNSIDETREILKASLPVIKEIAENTISSYGKDYTVFVTLDKANFPTKAYGDVVLPAGTYEACRVIIGDGKGENWWCVMYPPLCYLDVSSGIVPIEGKEQLKEELKSDEYSLIADSKKYHIRFKMVDTINSLICGENYKKRN